MDRKFLLTAAIGYLIVAVNGELSEVHSLLVYQARPISLAHWKLCRAFPFGPTPTSSKQEKWV